MNKEIKNVTVRLYTKSLVDKEEIANRLEETFREYGDIWISQISFGITSKVRHKNYLSEERVNEYLEGHFEKLSNE